MAMKYEKFVEDFNMQDREGLPFKIESSTNWSIIAIVK